MIQLLLPAASRIGMQLFVEARQGLRHAQDVLLLEENASQTFVPCGKYPSERNFSAPGYDLNVGNNAGAWILTIGKGEQEKERRGRWEVEARCLTSVSVSSRAFRTLGLRSRGNGHGRLQLNEREQTSTGRATSACLAPTRSLITRLVMHLALHAIWRSNAPRSSQEEAEAECGGGDEGWVGEWESGGKGREGWMQRRNSTVHVPFTASGSR